MRGVVLLPSLHAHGDHNSLDHHLERTLAVTFQDEFGVAEPQDVQNDLVDDVILLARARAWNPVREDSFGCLCIGRISAWRRLQGWCRSRPQARFYSSRRPW